MSCVQNPHQCGNLNLPLSIQCSTVGLIITALHGNRDIEESQFPYMASIEVTFPEKAREKQQVGLMHHSFSSQKYLYRHHQLTLNGQQVFDKGFMSEIL